MVKKIIYKMYDEDGNARRYVVSTQINGVEVSSVLCFTHDEAIARARS